MDTSTSFSLREHLEGNEKEVFSLIITGSICQVATHEKKDLWISSTLWRISTDIENHNQVLYNKEAFLAYFRKYILSPDGSLLIFGKDCKQNQNDSLEMRMKTQNKRRGHNAIFIIVSDVPDLTRLLRRILRYCSIKVIQLKVNDFSEDVDVSKSSVSVVSVAAYNGAENSNSDVNQVQCIHDLAHLAVGLQLKEILERMDPPQKKYNTRSLTVKGKDLIKNFEVTDKEGNVYIKGFHGEVVKTKVTQEGELRCNVKFEDGCEETMHLEELLGKYEECILNLYFFFIQNHI